MSSLNLEDSLNLLTKFKGLGTSITKENYFIFFGNDKLQLDHIKEVFPDTCLLKQVHGNRITKASTHLIEADGHYSSKKNQALIIRTADCLPVFFSNKSSVVALHAGWRGVANKILSRAKIENLTKNATHLFIGPHIQQRSFDLDTKNVLALLKKHKLNLNGALNLKIASPSIYQRDHYLIDLSLLLSHEARSIGFSTVAISPENTFSSYQHNSYRRNNRNTNRNLSFIVKL